jgi:hypothetical protein
MGASRNFECDATGKPCGDPRCKKNFCVLDHQEPTHRPPSNEPFRRDVIQSEAEKVARDWIRWGRLLRIPTKLNSKRQHNIRQSSLKPSGDLPQSGHFNRASFQIEALAAIANLAVGAERYLYHQHQCHCQPNAYQKEYSPKYNID